MRSEESDREEDLLFDARLRAALSDPPARREPESAEPPSSRGGYLALLAASVLAMIALWAVSNRDDPTTARQSKREVQRDGERPTRSANVLTKLLATTDAQAGGKAISQALSELARIGPRAAVAIPVLQKKLLEWEAPQVVEATEVLAELALWGDVQMPKGSISYKSFRYDKRTLPTPEEDSAQRLFRAAQKRRGRAEVRSAKSPEAVLRFLKSNNADERFAALDVLVHRRELAAPGLEAVESMFFEAQPFFSSVEWSVQKCRMLKLDLDQAIRRRAATAILDIAPRGPFAATALAWRIGDASSSAFDRQRAALALRRLLRALPSLSGRGADYVRTQLVRAARGADTGMARRAIAMLPRLPGASVRTVLEELEGHSDRAIAAAASKALRGIAGSRKR